MMKWHGGGYQHGTQMIMATSSVEFRRGLHGSIVSVNTSVTKNKILQRSTCSAAVTLTIAISRGPKW